jgi:HTH-type transcriptional regulator/antitoxin HigA
MITKRYLELVRAFPLRPIRSESELDRASKIAGDLAVKKKLTVEERDYLDVLSDLIIKYEDERHPIEPVSEDRMLAFLIEQKGVSQQQCSRDAGIAGSTLCAVMQGKRKLTREQVERLCRYFHVPPTVFICTASEATVGMVSK